MSRALTKKEEAAQQLQQQHQRDRYIEEEEKHASASASAGLNLNIFGALSGAFSSKSRKSTHQKPDGSSQSIEDREEMGKASGVAAGRGQAYAQGASEQGARKMRGVEGESARVERGEGRKVEKVDHLGIEG